MKINQSETEIYVNYFVKTKRIELFRRKFKKKKKKETKRNEKDDDECIQFQIRLTFYSIEAGLKLFFFCKRDMK